MSVLHTQDELWNRLRAAHHRLLSAYEGYANAESDGVIFRLTITIQDARIEISELSEALRKKYGHDVLLIECEDI
jgi:hypothetical protein